MNIVAIVLAILTYQLQSKKTQALCDNNNIDTIVVGGGIAGLGAAKALTNVGECVLIIEAKDYIGGRIKTINLGGMKTDLGASWIEGITQNPMKKLADKYNAKCVNNPDANTWAAYGLGYDETNNQNFNYKYIEQYQKGFLSKLGNIRKRLNKNANTKQGAEVYYKMSKLSSLDYRIAHYSIEEEYIGLDYGVESDKYSLKYFDEDGWFRGPQCVFPQGYSQIVNGLAEGLSILYSKPVKTIQYSNGGVVVTTNDSQQFRANQVIITVSLNVLKSTMIQFQPQLPVSKKSALNRLDMGHFHKIILTFSNKFWKTLRIAYVASDTSESVDYYDFTYAYGTPTLVAFFNGGSPLVGMSDGYIVNACLEQLSTALKSNAPQPTNYVISRWTDEPYTLGSYTYIPVGGSFNDIKIVSQKVGNSVYFAGEGTHPQHFSTTHGALLSGIRAAQEINENAYLDY